MKTAVIHSYNGMGDLIWHLPYIHAIVVFGVRSLKWDIDLAQNQLIYHM